MWTNTYEDDLYHLAFQINNTLDYMKSPDLLFLQLQHSNRAEALSQLATMLSSRNSINYTYASITPEQEGPFDETAISMYLGPVYLYNPAVLRLQKHNLSSPGTTNQVLLSSDGKPVLKYNPGVLMPSTDFDEEMLPLIAAWETLDGKSTFFTINSVPPRADAGNDPYPKPLAQATSDFITQVLSVDETARIIAAGSFRN
jgi:hypothetical protein